jgi:hypothetical protein
MLHWLMSWCVPARALRFHTNFTDDVVQNKQLTTDLAAVRQNA